MNKNTVLYGLLIAGGLFAYFAYKKKNASLDKDTTAPLAPTGSIKAMTTPLNKKDDAVFQNPKLTLGGNRTSVSQIVEPIIGTGTESELSNLDAIK
jgi:hypothetical protein